MVSVASATSGILFGSPVICLPDGKGDDCIMLDSNKNGVESLPIRPFDLAAVLALLAVFSLTTGYTYPAIAFNMEARGYFAALIGDGSLRRPWHINKRSAN